MTTQTGLSARILPIGLSLAGICMTVLAVGLLISAAKLGVFMRMMLGFIGVIFVNSVILSLVALRLAISNRDDAAVPEKVILVGLSVCTGIGLLIV